MLLQGAGCCIIIQILYRSVNCGSAAKESNSGALPEDDANTGAASAYRQRSWYHTEVPCTVAAVVHAARSCSGRCQQRAQAKHICLQVGSV